MRDAWLLAGVKPSEKATNEKSQVLLNECYESQGWIICDRMIEEESENG